MKPPHGLCLSCQFVRAVDGDTVEISFPGSVRVWKIRLVDAWCPETNRGPEESRAKGRAARQFTRECCERNAEHLSVFIPAPTDPINLLSALTFDRIPGYIYLTNEHTLNEAIVKHGHGYRTKPEQKQSEAAGTDPAVEAVGETTGDGGE